MATRIQWSGCESINSAVAELADLHARSLVVRMWGTMTNYQEHLCFHSRTLRYVYGIWFNSLFECCSHAHSTWIFWERPKDCMPRWGTLEDFREITLHPLCCLCRAPLSGIFQSAPLEPRYVYSRCFKFLSTYWSRAMLCQCLVHFHRKNVKDATVKYAMHSNMEKPLVTFYKGYE